MQNEILFCDLGLQPYQQVWDLQEKLLKENVAIKSALAGDQSAVVGSQLSVISKQPTTNYQLPTTNHKPQTTNYLLFVEHPPVYTLGKNGKESNLLLNKNQAEQNGIEYFHINRGGDITFHGPQQLVAYPIFDLDKFKPDLGWYLRNLEEVIILTLAEYGITGQRSKGETGVWIDAGKPGKERKICAIGIRCSRWITMHGFALNVNTDLSYFNNIIPCGIQNKQVTSLQKEFNIKIEMREVKHKVLSNLGKVFQTKIIECSEEL